MPNQHIVEITIIWPDDQWDQTAEQDYLIGSLKGVIEYLDQHPIQNRQETRSIINTRGRKYAEIFINPCK